MTEVNLGNFAVRLVRVIEILASVPAAQLRYLEQIGISGLVDELALQFDDSVATLPELRFHCLISEDAERAVRAVDSALADMSASPAEVWTESALETAPEWSRVRELAGQALVVLPLLDREVER